MDYPTCLIIRFIYRVWALRGLGSRGLGFRVPGLPDFLVGLSLQQQPIIVTLMLSAPAASDSPLILDALPGLEF